MDWNAAIKRDIGRVDLKETPIYAVYKNLISNIMIKAGWK